MKTRNQTYIVEHASGEYETLRLPLIFTSKDLTDRWPNCIVWLYVPQGRQLWLDPIVGRTGVVQGPYWAHYNPDLKVYDGYVLDNPAKQIA